jgi:hypothetical protein
VCRQYISYTRLTGKILGAEVEEEGEIAEENNVSMGATWIGKY